LTVQEFEQFVNSLPSYNPAALIVLQGEALRDLERARKHVIATKGKPRCIQKIADDELLDAITFVEEFDALKLEAF
jgi:hypothetical protein